MIFDGRQFANKLEAVLKEQVARSSRPLKLVAILDPTNLGSVTYTNLKEKAAKRIGVEFERYEMLDARSKILEANNDKFVDGVIIQLPFPDSEKLINLIDKNKDVDGLRDDSPFIPAVVVAVKKILQMANASGEVLVVGAKGRVGHKLVQELGASGIDKDDFDPQKLLQAKIIVSATGQAGLIKPQMVQEGVVAIDLGYPMGDFDADVALKASFFTPVPGGVGPVTVACLFENILTVR